jgi:hypothetical protein
MRLMSRFGNDAAVLADVPVPRMLIDDLGPWLAAEYVAVRGRKTPRGWPRAGG